MKIISVMTVLFFCSLSIAAQQGQEETGFQFVAHRGASYLAPENTLASIELAWKLGADGAECDVMLTADHQVILFHDKNSKKLTGKSFVIKETSWEELGKLSIQRKENHRPEYKNEPIPLLKDVLGTIPDGRMLVIEIKTGPEILPHLKQVIDSHWKSGKISFIAFDFETIKATKALYPDIPCYYLSALKSDLKKRFDDVVACGLDGVDLRHGIIDQEVMEQCQGAGLDVWCWTVNDTSIALKMKELGVSAVTTDRPAWLKQNL